MIYKCQNPILLITFIKFDTAFEVLEKIKETTPEKLYISSDGGRTQKEHQKILAFRKELLSRIDWKCEVFTLFDEKNNGCKYGPYNAISWFFSHEEQGIILEDDCLPNNSFFRFCDELLHRYAKQENIAMISGWSALALNPKTKLRITEDYYFSKYNFIWGWASWRRSWKSYRIDEKFENINELYFDSAEEKKYWNKIVKVCQKKNLDAWDYPWLFHLWKTHMLCIAPKHNMICNIGIGRLDATHTSSASKFNNMQTFEINFPLIHPNTIIRNKSLDEENFRIVFQPPMFFVRLLKKIYKILTGQ